MPHNNNTRDNLQKLVRVCVIGRAQGLHGEVNVLSYTDSPEERFARGSELTDDKGQVYRVRAARQFKRRWILKFAGVSDRTAAEALNGITLYAEQSYENENEEDDVDEGIYYEDLIGMRAQLEDGTDLGEVTDVQEAPAQLLLVLTEPHGHESLVPYVEAIVPDVDLENRVLTLDPPAGLLQEH